MEPQLNPVDWEWGRRVPQRELPGHAKVQRGLSPFSPSGMDRTLRDGVLAFLLVTVSWNAWHQIQGPAGPTGDRVEGKGFVNYLALFKLKSSFYCCPLGPVTFAASFTS